MRYYGSLPWRVISGIFGYSLRAAAFAAFITPLAYNCYYYCIASPAIP